MFKTDDKKLASSRKWKAKNKERVSEYRRQYFATNKNQEYKTHKQWIKNHPDRKSLYDSKYRAKHLAEIKAHRASPEYKALKNKAARDRYWSDFRYKKEKDLRARIHQALRLYGNTPNKVCSMDLWMGCTAYEFKMHIQSQFNGGMNWSNIHIDHIKPCAAFDMKNISDQLKCFHYSNCQPLFPIDNIRKKNKIL